MDNRRALDSHGYERIKPIGKGAFGAAILVRKRSDGKKYVAKEINLSRMKREERAEAKNEIRVISKLNHHNIIRYVEHFEENSVLFIVMEYADGGDVDSKIKQARGVRMSEEVVLHFFIQLCLALQHLHEKKILHRDLKAQNIFLTSQNVVKLGDFGISTILQHTHAQARTMCGTPYYFSPELCQNKPYNNKSDIWSLGCVLYELTTLKHAFEGQNMKGLLQKIIRGNYPPIPTTYSRELKELIDSMLQRDPAKRPSSSNILRLPFISARIKAYIANPERPPASVMGDSAEKPPPQPQPQPQAGGSAQAAPPPRPPIPTPQQQKQQLQQQQLLQEKQQQQHPINPAHHPPSHRPGYFGGGYYNQTPGGGPPPPAPAPGRGGAYKPAIQPERERRQKEAAAKAQEVLRLQKERETKEREERERRQKQYQALQDQKAALEKQQRQRQVQEQRHREVQEQRQREFQKAREQEQADRRQRELEERRAREAAAAARRAKMKKDKKLYAQREAGWQGLVEPQQQPDYGAEYAADYAAPDYSNEPPPPAPPPTRVKGLPELEVGDRANAFWEARMAAQRNREKRIQEEQRGSSPPVSPPEPSQQSPVGGRREQEVYDPDRFKEAWREQQREAERNKKRIFEEERRVQMELEEPEDPAEERPPSPPKPYISPPSPVNQHKTEERENPEYTGMIGDMKAVMDRLENSVDPEDGDFAEENMVDMMSEWKVNGKAIDLKGVSNDDPLMHRIECLRMFIEEAVGIEKMVKAYNLLNDMGMEDDEDEAQGLVEAILGPENEPYMPLITHLIFCEESVNRRDNGLA